MFLITDIVDDMKLFHHSRKIVYDTETGELLTFEEFEYKKTMKELEENNKNLVCVLCGELWEPGYKNLCECGGFCTWGESKGAQPLSWNEDGTAKAPPKGIS